MHPLIAFYAGTGTDHRGRTLSGILAFSNTELESCHDYIQWLFPLRTPSPYNPEVPVLCTEVEQAFQQDEQLQRRLHQSCLRMLRFFGIVLRETPQGFELLLPEEVGHLHWLTVDNHNHRRITRMLASLQLLGLETHAMALWQGLQRLAQICPQAISADTLLHWQRAATGEA